MRASVYDLHIKIGRAKFEALNAELFEKCIQIVKQCLEDARMNKEQIKHVVLVGGSTRIPKVHELLKQFFHGKQLCKTINHDEVVAYGAALRAATLNNEGVNVVLMDVTPLSLGIRNDNGVMSVVVPRNTPFPTIREQGRTTVRDNQLNVCFSVYEGERAMAAYNNLLGQFSLHGIQAALCGVPKIKVVFEIDVDGILRVSARNEGSGVSNHITITNDGGRLSKEEIERMVRDAERFRMEDEEAKRNRTAKSEFEDFVYNMTNRVKEAKAKAKGAMKMSELKCIEQIVSSVEEWLDENKWAKAPVMKSKLKILKEICSPIFFQIY